MLDPRWTQRFGVNPLDGTVFLDTASAFVKAFLHLLAGEGVWGRGRHLSPFPQQSCINLVGVDDFHVLSEFTWPSFATRSPHLAGYSAPKHERASVSGAHRPPEAASS